MSSHFTVVYDACVLYPAPLRDFLMRLALTDLFRARWSDMIHDEWTRNALAQRPDLKPENLKRTRTLMNAHVRDCLVTDFEHLIASVELPDKDDRHVVAAAMHRRSLKNPPKTVDEYLDTLRTQGLTQTVGLLREWKVAF